jgi:hypothetical protein
MSWTSTLADPTIKATVEQAVADASVTYQEMLGLLQGAAAGGISAAEFSDLQAVYANAQTMFASDYLRAISHGVIHANPANAKWWGGAGASAQVADLGNMAAGMSEQKAGWLVDKWFLGKDLPMPVVGGDTANNKASSGVFSYTLASGPLFVAGAAPTDVNQGNAGTCYLVAALGSIADVNGDFITSAFIDNGNGTWGVRFYLNDAPVYVTVDASVPVGTSGKIALSGNATQSPDGELWVTLFEKAYAQLNTYADINNSQSWSGEASYQAVEGGWANPIRQITNQTYTYYSAYYSGVPDNYKAGELVSTNSATYKQTIIDGLAGGAVGWLGSFGETTDAGNGLRNLVSGHAFMILGYEAATDSFVIRNPWGGAGGGYNAEFKMTIGEFWNANVKAIVALSDPGSAPPPFSYSAAAAATEANPVAEGGKAVFTLTRNGTGTASTVYVSTSAQTAGAGDFSALDKVAVTFAAYETTASVAVDTFADNLAEGTETFRLNVFAALGSTESVANAVAHIADATAQAYTYTVASSAAEAGAAVAEGASVTFTVTRSGSGTASTVYLSTAAGTAGAADIVGLARVPLAFSAYETTKTVTVATVQDSLAEEVEFFSLEVHEGPESTTPAASATGFVKDAVLPAYSYMIQSSAGSEAEAATEGEAITFSIWRSGSGTESTVHVATRQASAGAADFVGFDMRAITFAPYQTVATVTVQTNADWWLESAEYFALDLYLKPNDGFYSTSGLGFLKDNPNLQYNYTLTNNSPSTAPVAEGGAVVFTLTRDGSGTESTVFLSTVAGTAGAADYAGLDKVPVTFAAYETVKSVSVNLLTDSAAEDTEHFWVNLYRNLADAGETAFSQAYIANIAPAAFTYSVASSAADEAGAVGEGGTVTFTITRSAAGAASTVYVATSNGTAGAGADFAGLAVQEVTFKADETTRTVTVDTYQDEAVEAGEYFWLDLFTSYADAQAGNWASYAAGHIKDVAASGFTYALSSNATATSPVGEGGSIVFTITRSGTGAASTVYVSTSDSTAWAGLDYAGVDTLAVTFKADETVRTVSVATYQDNVAEGTERFWLDLYTSYADAQSGDWETFASGHIGDGAASAFGYTVASSAPSDAPVDEGGSVTFTITRSGTGSAATVYVATSDSSAWAGFDYDGVAALPVEFAAGETVKTVTVATFQDSATEENERFWLDLYTSYADVLTGDWTAFASATIRDVAAVSFDYSISSSTSAEAPAAEGEGITFTITRSGTGAASTVYVGTSDSSAWGGFDFEYLGGVPVDFAADETQKTVTVATYQDGFAEGPETFWLDLYGSYGDYLAGNWDSYAAGHITDGTQVSFTYSVTSNTSPESPAVEGGAVEFTITRSGTGSTSTVYIATIDATAWAWFDYEGIFWNQITFGADETVRTVTVPTYADGFAEGGEYFWLDLYTSVSDAIDENPAAYGTAYIVDAFGGALPPLAALDALPPALNAMPPPAPGEVGGVLTAADITTRSFRGHEGGAFANDFAFAAIKGDGGVVSWGQAQNGGDSAAVAGQLAGVVEVFSTGFAFAALRGDGSVVTWGSAGQGGDSSAVAALLNGTIDVTTIHSSSAAFAALRADGSVVTWGDGNTGGNSAAVAAALDGTVDVVAIASTMSAFAALRADGSVVTWGFAGFGGDSAAVAAQLDGSVAVTGVVGSGSAFAAMRADGSVVTWGNPTDGGDSAAVAAALDGTIDAIGLAATTSAFAAIRSDGSVVTWGAAEAGGDSASVASLLDGTLDAVGLSATDQAFAAIRADGSVVAWGNAASGGNASAVAAALDGTVDVVGLAATSSAFAALRADGTVVSWGHGPHGGDQGAAAASLTGVVRLAATDQAFAALRADGSVVTWGGFLGGGNSADVAALLDGTVDVVQILGTSGAFSALREDGSVVSWGDQALGGAQGGAAAALSGIVRLGDGLPDRASASVAATDAVKPEGAAGTTAEFTFAVTRSGDTAGALSLGWRVVPGALRPAVAGDFAGGALPSGTVDFAAGVTNAGITVVVAGDDVLEGHKDFVVVLDPAPGVAVAGAGATGTILEDEPIADVAVVRSASGDAFAAAPAFYSGPVAQIERELVITLTTENLNVAAAGPNWFIRTDAGDDAISVAGGTNVLDGGTGSNFLTGAGGFDTFFVDARGATLPIWSTLNGFGKGDAATMWGVAEATHHLLWAVGQGAPGFEGLTLHAVPKATGQPIASLTLPGYIDTALGSTLLVQEGFDPGSGSSYIYVLGV